MEELVELPEMEAILKYHIIGGEYTSGTICVTRSLIVLQIYLELSLTDLCLFQTFY